MGVDIPDIRCIVHVDRPRMLLDYAQESGRAGRDGRKSEVIVIEDDDGKAWEDDSDQTEEEKGLVQRYIRGKGGMSICRRVMLDGYLDGRKDRIRCEEGEELCDVCGRGEGSEDEEMEEETVEKRMEEKETVEERMGEEEIVEKRIEEEEIMEGQKEMEQAKEVQREFWQQERERRGRREEFSRSKQREYLEMEWLRQQLQNWTERCGICKGAGLEADNHNLKHCKSAESQKARKMFWTIQKTIKFEAYSGCFGCGVPQEFCNGWEDDEKGKYRKVKGGLCQFKGVLIAGVLGMVFEYKEQVWGRWQQRLEGFRVDLGSDESLISYLSAKRRLKEAESNNLAGEFCWISALIEK